MASSILKIIVLTGSDRPEVLDTWSQLVPQLRATSGVDVVGTYSREEQIPINIDADLVVVLGGDGSILRGCRQLGAAQKPIVGINLGRLGFLADLTTDDFCRNLDQLITGQYEIVEHLMFECQHRSGDGSTRTDLGLNEVTITSGSSLKMLDIKLDIDFEPVTTFSCDGLIISTPVGSTAHNLSAGGPILRQDLQAFCITPICPHTLTVRPIVDSAERTYGLTVPDAPEGVMLVIDGQISRPFGPHDNVRVKRSDATFKLVRFPGHSYYSTLHRKLGWRGQLDYRERKGL
ncbi:MAG: NAD(+)/NADH kinase [Fuerstiella sp.]|jgi:NAD+ kinase|nr:NAD(+)/NADH kinase [Fuerstiella sp.]MCP4510637.1 NAD(+)/NADH kinase [Fuerstiella sp.]MDG2129808.1 NAD(+)/NADH kinase [Fuerstiella sp.]